MPKLGDVVLFTAYGRTLNALVLSSRNMSSHEGKGGEPLLSIAYVDPAREVGNNLSKVGPLVERPGYVPQVHIEHDVVHASHEFSADYRKQKGLLSQAQIIADRGHGEWDFSPTEPCFICGSETECECAASLSEKATNSAPEEQPNVSTSE